MTSEIKRLEEIREKVENNVRLSAEEGIFLDNKADLFTLGELANIVRERKKWERYLLQCE